MMAKLKKFLSEVLKMENTFFERSALNLLESLLNQYGDNEAERQGLTGNTKNAVRSTAKKLIENQRKEIQVSSK